jgi:hypothetical protein
VDKYPTIIKKKSGGILLLAMIINKGFSRWLVWPPYLVFWLNIHLIDLFMQNLTGLKAASGRNAWQSGRGCACFMLSACRGSSWQAACGDGL